MWWWLSSNVQDKYNGILLLTEYFAPLNIGNLDTGTWKKKLKKKVIWKISVQLSLITENMTYHNNLFVIAMEACRLHLEGVNTPLGLTQRLNTPIDVIVEALVEAVYTEEIGDSDIPTCVYNKVYEEISGR